MSTIQVIRTTEDATLELVDVPTPTDIQPFDLLVRVKGVGLNPADRHVRLQTHHLP